MKSSVQSAKPLAVGNASVRVEFLGALSTYLTLSYVFLLNPVLLHKSGIDLSAAFFGTVISAALSTLLMGIWARLPFAVAPAPSLATFFVSYLYLTLEMSWQGALAAVVISGLLSIGATWLNVRQHVIDAVPDGVKIGVLFCLCGFLVANGLVQAKLISHTDGWIDLKELFSKALDTANLIIFGVGFGVTVLFSLKWAKFSGAPLLGILAASIVAAKYGVVSTSEAELSWKMLPTTILPDFSALVQDLRTWFAILVFFIIDFYGGVGKFIGLFAAMGEEGKHLAEKGMGPALYTDGIGNVVGGFLGASGLAVFVSSAVGIAAGARTGLTAIFISLMMLASLIYIPLVGSIPIEALSGILAYIGFLLLPKGTRYGLDLVLYVAAALVAFASFSLDKAIFLVFLFYSSRALGSGFKREQIIFHATTLLLFVSVVAQWLLR